MVFQRMPTPTQTHRVIRGLGLLPWAHQALDSVKDRLVPQKAQLLGLPPPRPHIGSTEESVISAHCLPWVSEKGTGQLDLRLWGGGGGLGRGAFFPAVGVATSLSTWPWQEAVALGILCERAMDWYWREKHRDYRGPGGIVRPRVGQVGEPLPQNLRRAQGDSFPKALG